ncbi:glycosyl hydrolase [Asanoa sp. NPDC049518]|uniref:glycoside hydrolase family 26 protein n=1 Tax=unclassified Asanoa TaxID=2685164 RepID=UPI00343DAAEF
MSDTMRVRNGKRSGKHKNTLEQGGSRIRFRVWMTINSVILLGLTAWILLPDSTGSDLPAVDSPQSQVGASALPEASDAPPPTKEQVMAIPGVRFGLSAPQVPYSSEELNRLSNAAGARPSILQFFVKWTEPLRPEAIGLSYDQNALPLISWEPWAGSSGGESQPKYALDTITAGDHDKYVRAFATTIKDLGYPVALRFAHEMNGKWYPWSESRSGNDRGDYVKAWRHLHDVFGEVGATNVIWVWSPNILRPVPNVSIEKLYPGDKYVDWAGFVGYAVDETTAKAVFQPTITAIRKFTKKPLLITETGAQPGSKKLGFIKDFFEWLPEQNGLVGFVWFEFSEKQGGSADWRYSADTRYAKAFKQGMSKLKLAAPPVHR